MKKLNAIICVAAISVLVCGCGNKNQFTLEGNVGSDALNGKQVYLCNMTDPNEVIDSTLVTDGKFTFACTVEESWLGVVYNREGFVQTCVVEPGTVVMTPDSVGGTELNNRMYALLQDLALEEQEQELKAYAELYYTAPDASQRADAERLYDSLEAVMNAQRTERAMNCYGSNRDNLIGAVAMEYYIRANDALTYSTFDSLMREASPVVANYPSLQKKLEQLRCVDQTSVGKHYTDVQGVDGKLSDLVDGKLALVDFYASWCGPCRNEIRDNLVPLWKKYQKKGLVIVGLNVWERGNREAREAAHAKVMADLGITYPQLVDSTRTATDTYGVIGIPQILLIGPDGTILARDLRGAAIEEAIVKALGK